MMDVDKAHWLWKELHRCGPAEQHTQELVFPYWLEEVRNTIGCKTCFKKLERFMKKWPPDYGEGFHLWGLCLHDYVNKELGKSLFCPQLTLAPLTEKGIIQ